MRHQCAFAQSILIQEAAIAVNGSEIAGRDNWMILA